MDKLRSILVRMIVCAIAYTMLEALFRSEGKRKGIFESASKAVTAALTAAVIDVG